MTNWVKRIETAMEDCPSAEELEKEKQVPWWIKRGMPNPATTQEVNRTYWKEYFSQKLQGALP